jgi:hypothetical protein
MYRSPCVSVTDKERSALLRHVYKFCGRQATNSGKSGEPLFKQKRPHIKSFLKNNFKNLKSFGVP